MAIIREDKIIDWNAIGRDKYLRNREAPSLYNDPITTRDIRGGAEVVSRSGNIMPKAITRDKLGDDSLLVAMNINISSSNAVVVATGYDKSLNDYLYAVTWDGVDYYLRRFNTADMLSPYQDGYSVNLPAVSRDSILSITVLSNKVGVLYQNPSGLCKMDFYDFDLNYLSTISAYNFAYDGTDFLRNLIFDGQYLVHSITSAAKFLTKQLLHDSNANINYPQDSAPWQQFKTTSNGGNIVKVRVLLNSPNGSTSVNVQLRNNSNNILATVNNLVVPGGSVDTWVSATFNLVVSASTVYRIAVFTGGPDTVNWRYKNSDVYADGQFSGGAAQDAAFEVYQEIPSAWQGKICRFSITDYSLVDSFSYQGGYTQPKELMAYDKKFHYGFETAGKKIIKFAIQDSAITVASEQSTQETIRGIMHFNNFIFIVYTIGASIVAVPISV